MIDVPANYSPRIEERHLPFQRAEHVSDGRRVYHVGGAGHAEAGARAARARLELRRVARHRVAAIKWSDIAKWYAGLSRDRYTTSPAIDATLADVVKDAHTLDDSLRAVHRWVAQDFRYVSLSLGIAGFQPHPPESMFENNYGDCKDKATFFVAACVGWASRRIRCCSAATAAWMRRCRARISSIT